MATPNTITHLIETLTEIDQNNRGCSESANRATKDMAQETVRNSTLDEDTVKTVCAAIAKAANPSAGTTTTTA